MLKKIIILVVLVVMGIAAYYGSFYFRNTEVDEAAPELMERSEIQEKGDLVVEQRIGEFQEVDRLHKGEGKAILLESDISKILRFEDFKVTNGPDLYVWLTKTPNPTTDLESLGEYIDLGRLKGNIGNQNYTITQNIDGYDTVVVWCKQFSQLFTYANLR